jgi:hypothetical protein
LTPVPSTPAPARPLTHRLTIGLFVAALLFHAWGVSVGWRHINLPGYEFRQTQTAISALFIQQENNFSLAYPTPVLGAPWSVPFEFPLYQWSAVAVSNATGLTLVEAGRLVGVLCFYLALVAVHGLLRRLGLAAPQRLLVLAFVLTGPLSIYYGRAFLIETMALMAGAWYLHALVEGMARPSGRWLAVAAVAGTIAGLVKVTTFLVWLIPAFGCALWWLWRARAAGHLGRTFGRLAAVHAAPFAAAWWWVGYSDRIKALNPSGAGLTSASLSGFNLGTGHHFDPRIWSEWWAQITGNVAGPAVLLIAALLALAAPRRWRWLAGGAAVLFLFSQLAFPVLYARHGYYYMASAVFLLAALGLAAVGFGEAPRVPRGLALAAAAALIALQARHYVVKFYPDQYHPGDAGGLSTALREMTGPDESLVIAGADWSSIIPYYAQRRALMVRSDLPGKREYLDRAFPLMRDQQVAAVVLMGHERANAMFLELATRAFDLDPAPVFTWHHESLDATVYLNRQAVPGALDLLSRRTFYEVTALPRAGQAEHPLQGREFAYRALLPANRKIFRTINPRPVRFYSTFGPELWTADKPGEERFATHPDTKLWFALGAGPHRIRTNLEIPNAAWADVPAPDASDGVELVAATVGRDGTRTVLQHRYFNPRLNPADRGRQPVDWTVTLPPDNELELSVNAGPSGNGARDWASLGAITID